MGTGRQGASLERQVTITIVAAALFAALAASGTLGWLHALRARSDNQANAVAQAMSDAIANGAKPATIVEAFVTAGSIRSATVYAADGSVRARNGVPAPNAELTCHEIAGGGSLCIEARALAGTTAVRDSIPGVAIALVAAIVLASFAVRVIRKRLRAIRGTIDQTIRDQTYTTRIAPQRGELGPFAEALNQLLEQMQTRDTNLRRRTNELEAANKDLESFASAVSHDLRAPLGSIAGFAQALDEDYRDRLDEVGQECVGWIRQSADQMSQLIEGLLQMARLSRIEVQRSEVDLSSMAERIAATLLRTHPDRTVDFRIAEGIVASGDEKLLTAVLENLINNAWKFTSKRANARIEIGVKQDGGPPAYFVRDNGAGFDPQYAAKMFRPFQRLHSDKEFGGTGIGLATVQKIVQRHGGRAWAEGEPERGATVYFTTGSQESAA